MRRSAWCGWAAVAGLVVAPAAAQAHSLKGRADLPVPLEVFYWAAAAVLAVSFAALGLGWRTPRLARYGWRPLPSRVDEALSGPVAWTVRAVVLALFVLTVVAAAIGSTEPAQNIAPFMTYIAWWLGLVPVSVLLGNVWRETNPWTTVARLLRLPAQRPARPVPASLGWWLATAIVLGWAWLELVYPTPGHLRLFAAIMLAYSALTLWGMWRYGREPWLDHGEGFSVYSGVLALLSPVERRGGRIGLRPPLAGATTLVARPGMTAFIGALIGTVSYDGFSRTSWWVERSALGAQRLAALGVDRDAGALALQTAAFLVLVGVAIGAFAAASAAAGAVSGHADAAARYAHSLVPIAVAYVVAHNFSFFVFQSQELIRLASDPFGFGWDLFGTAGRSIDYGLVTIEQIWYVQVASIVVGHVIGLALAHDRALELAGSAGAAVRSQLPMLALMVFFTLTGMWFLSEGLSAGIPTAR